MSRRLRRVLAAHIWTWRPYTLGYIGLVGLAGAALATDRPSVPRLTAAWLVPTLVWTAAHYLGDYLDRGLDAISKPRRPIPSGRMGPATALVSGVVLIFVACAVGLSVNPRTVLVLAFGVGGAVAYSGWFKARGLSGNLVRGSLTGGVFLFGEMMAVSYPLLRLLPFAFAFWTHDAASNLVGTIRDVQGDRAGGYVTYPVRHGIRRAAWTAVGLYSAAVATAAAGALLIPGAGLASLGMVLLAGILGSCALRPLFARTLTPREALRSHEVLVVERLVLATALLGPGLGWPAAFGLLIPIAAFTLGTQRAMRSRHEFSFDKITADSPIIENING